MASKAKLLVVLPVIASLVFSGCAVSPAAPTPLPPTPTPIPPTPTPSITVDDLIGIWRTSGRTESAHYQFNEDGTYRRAGAVQWLETAPLEVGQFQLEGTVISFLTTSRNGNCPGQGGSYQIELTEPDLFQLVLQEDECQNRAIYAPGDWERVEP